MVNDIDNSFEYNQLKIYIEELESENRILCDKISQLNNENIYLKRINGSLVDSHERLEKIISGLHQLVDEKDKIILMQKKDLSRFGGAINRVRSLKKIAGKVREKGLRKVHEKKLVK